MNKQAEPAAAKGTELILRHEANVRKELYRAMRELERLQRRRQGEFVPPFVNAHLAGGPAVANSMEGLQVQLIDGCEPHVLPSPAVVQRIRPALKLEVAD